MTTQIHQLVYCSRLALPKKNLQDEIDGILVSARRSNARAGITGGLFVTGDIAAQLLEGPMEAVERTYAKICADPRHHEITLLRRRDVSRRIFPTWAMGFEITVDAMEEVLDVLARAFSVQNDDVADDVTNLIKDGGIRVEM